MENLPKIFEMPPEQGLMSSNGQGQGSIKGQNYLSELSMTH